MAHGGMTKLLVSPDNYIALFPGQEKRVAFFAEFTDVDDKNITLNKVAGPSWVSIGRQRNCNKTRKYTRDI